MEEESIEVYLHPNPEIRSYLTHRAISPPRVGIFRNPLDEEARGALRTLGEIPARIVMDILSLPGVEEVHIKPKEIRVKKSITVTWETIQGPIIETLRRSLRRKGIRIVKK